jgi:hypothetical protein
MILVWLLVWAIQGAPHVFPWNDWFITLIISIVLL